MSKQNVSSRAAAAEGGAEVTIRDIARELSISHTTVSRALAGHPHISVLTKERVAQAVRRMGYLPNASARNMRGSPSSVVCLFVPDVQNDFYSTVAKLVADQLANNAMQLMLAVTEDDPEREQRELRASLQMRPAGVVIVPTAGPTPETRKMLKSTESVSLLRTHPGLTDDVVLVDDHAGTFAAADHLLGYGHRRLAYIGGGTDISTGKGRLEGFIDALKARNLTPVDVALGPPRPEFARHAVTAMMAQRNLPTALVLGSAELTLGALQGLRAVGLEWPRDLSVVGYHDPPWFELVGTGITTVRLPVRDLALTATSVLLSRVKSSLKETGAEQRPAVMRFAPTLVLRGSTAPAKPDG